MSCFSCIDIRQCAYFIAVIFRDAWDMAAEICLSQLPTLVDDPNAEFQVSRTNLLNCLIVCIL